MKHEQRKKKEWFTNIQANDERMMHKPLCINEERKLDNQYLAVQHL